jgi:2-polyprenyl-3-methyl-5-hydroxy-6-metoxy-1,4-benzoquinol methylase
VSIENNEILKRLSRVTFEDFKQMALDNALSNSEKIGFPNSYRQDYTQEIFADILTKLPCLSEMNKVILDIGCGCSELAMATIQFCQQQQHRLLLVDSQEMLSLLPDERFIEKIYCKFPENQQIFNKYWNSVDAIIVYSVLQHVVLEDNLFNFIDKALELLNSGGMLLLGDIPNISKRKRFFSSPKGIKTHQEFIGKNEVPEIDIFHIEHEKIDDSILMAILQRYRNFGFETYLIPQYRTLPMATRREDILIVKCS